MLLFNIYLDNTYSSGNIKLTNKRLQIRDTEIKLLAHAENFIFIPKEPINTIYILTPHLGIFGLISGYKIKLNLKGMDIEEIQK